MKREGQSILGCAGYHESLSMLKAEAIDDKTGWIRVLAMDCHTGLQRYRGLETLKCN